MPTAYVDKMADEGKGSKAELEHKWNKAKGLAADEGRKEDWPYIMGIFKKMIDAKVFAAVIKAYSPQPNTAFGQPSKGWPTVANDNNYMKSLVDSGQFTQQQVDEAWAKAKKIANENKAKDSDIKITYAYTTSIMQDLLGIKQKASLQVNAAARLKVMK